jgi:hypothetical protein
MPTPIIVIAAIVAFFAILFLIRVKVCVSYSNDFDFAVKYLFFTYRIKQPKKGQAKQEKKPPQKFTFEQLQQFLNLFERFKNDAKKLIIKFQKKIRIDLFKIDLTIGSDDAAATAITYGEACAIIFPAVSFLENLVKIKKSEITVKPDFNGNNNIIFGGCASMHLGSILAIGIASAFKVFVSLIKNPIHIEQRGVVK